MTGCDSGVIPLISIRPNDQNITLNIGESQTVIPRISGEFELMWASDDEAVATVVDGIITAVAPGEVTIMVHSLVYSVSASISVIVLAPAAQTIRIIGDDYITLSSLHYYALELEGVLASDVVWGVSPSSLASVSPTGALEPLGLGTVVLRAHSQLDMNIYDEIEIEIIRPSVVMMNITAPSEGYIDAIYQLQVTFLPQHSQGEIIWSSSDETIAMITSDGQLECLTSGSVEITATLVDNPTITSTHVILIQAMENLSLESLVVSNAYALLAQGSAVFYQSKSYEVGFNAFSNFSAAQNAAQVGSVIHLIDDVITESITVSKSDVVIVGKNDQVNPINQTRSQESVVEGKWTIALGVSNIEINGFAWTKGGSVEVLGQVSHFLFKNNYIYDSNINITPWTELATYVSGVIVFKEYSILSDQVIISNNVFENIGDVAINFSSMNNLKIMNNVFNGFSKDAIRSTVGIPNKDSQWLIMGNVFQNSPYNGIYFRTYGTVGTTYESIISIYDNHFKNLGNTEVLYSGAISFRNYQEGLTSVDIRHNTFEQCKNYILLRNNAVTTNQANFTGHVNYNSFKGIPNSYYFKNKNTTDSSATNPSQANLDYNFYADGLGNPINLSNYPTYFNGHRSNNNNISSKAMFDSQLKIFGSHVAYLESTLKLITSEAVTWQSLSPSIATVDATGRVTPLAKGSVVIVATSVTNPSISTRFEVIVKDPLHINYIKRILDIAIGEEGYKEGPNNDTKYGTWYGMPNQPWCAMFVSWSAKEAGVSTTIIPKYASVSLGMEWFQTRGLFRLKGSYIPKAGDIIFFKSDGASHTGLVISSDGTRVYTIEGNTSDMVAKRSYLLSYSKITGYGLPNYPVYDGEPFEFDISDATDGSGASTR